MLAACANLIKATGLPSDRERGNQMNPAPSGHKKHKSKVTSQKTRADNFRSSLLQTILGSFEFTPEDVFKIATSVYCDIPAGLYPSEERSSTIVRTKPSLAVTNAFLHVCAVSGHFDQAWLVMEDMMHRTQGDFKPDLATYRHVLKAAAVKRRKLVSQSLDAADVDTKVGEIIDYATDSLSKQSRVALWVKLSLGGLVGATVGKFTMMGILALPSSSIFSGATEPLGEQSIITSSQQPEGIIHLLASHEVALGIGFVTGLLTAGYYIRGSTQKPRMDTKEQVTKSRGQHPREDLPHARLFGLYFPDLKTTDKEEIREYLRKEAEV
ncbi:hypothetical protein BGX21_009264 [Mortierella sp. AD011]|nr:hypothetical protein BGX20_008775 [Mortierella sp. AD010]KAF9397096.1 hypothetical protein BGX21_009264 [Mortierella sp. AD011]